MVAQGSAVAQTTRTFERNSNPPKAPAPVERLGPSSLRIGNVHIDTAKKEVSVRGTVLEANVIEFVAVTKGGFKAYESALELETNAIDFNVALILIGLDPSRAVVPKMHMDPTIPKGDPVEVWVEWDDGNSRRRIRAEELVYNLRTKTTLPAGPWIYTGSVFMADTNAYLADVDGALIGFAHSPAPLIDSPRPLVPGVYGYEVLNPSLMVKPGTSISLTVRALPREK
jgi:hypothetical protein